MRKVKQFLATAFLAVTLSGCGTVSENLSLATNYAVTAGNYQVVKQSSLINVLDINDQALAEEYVRQIDDVMVFLNTFVHADSQHKAKLVVGLPIQVAEAKSAFARLSVLVEKNQDKFSDSQIETMVQMKNELEALYQDWDTLAGGNEQISQLLTIINTIVALKQTVQ